MAVAASFDESEAVLGRPNDVRADDCDPLCISRRLIQGFAAVISSWKLTQEELDEVNRTGRIWVGVMGITMPPIMVGGNKADFVTPDNAINNLGGRPYPSK